MIIIKKISKYLQVGLILTFFLPFFPSGCKSSSAVQSDSTAIEAPALPVDTSQVDSTTIDLNNDTLKTGKNNTIDSKSSDKEETTSDKIIKRVPIMELILKPGGNYSGIGYIVDVFWYFLTCFGIIITLALWIIGLRLKIKGNQSFQILNIIGLVLLYTTNPVMLSWLDDTKLWGYWFCFWYAVVMILLDFSLIIQKKKTGA